MTRNAILVVAFLACFAEARSQETSEGLPMQAEWSGVTEQPGSDGFDRDAFEDRLALRFHPLDVNRASREQLLCLPDVAPELIDRLLAWRGAGAIRSIMELGALPGMTPAALRALRTYTRVHTGIPHSGHLLVEASSTLDERDLRERGTTYAHAQANDLRVQMHEAAESGLESSLELEGGIRLAKDPGEQAISDAVAGYLLVRAPSHIEAIIGTFRPTFGTGLMLQSGRTIHTTGTLLRSSDNALAGTHPTMSIDDLLHARGIAIAGRLADCSITGFFSLTPLHGVKDSAGRLVSIYSDGVFQTADERAKRNVAAMQWCGATIVWPATSALQFGAALDRTRFSRPINPSDWIEGRTCASMAMFAAGPGVWSVVEAAADNGGARAGCVRLRCNVPPAVSAGIEITAVESGFFAPHGSFSSLADGMSSGEQTVRGAVEVRMAPECNLEAGYEERQRTSTGHASTIVIASREWNAELRAFPGPSSECSIEFRRVSTETPQAAAGTTPTARRIGTKELQVIRLSARTGMGSLLRTRTRVEISRSAGASDDGCGGLLFEELSIVGTSVQVAGRVTLFEVDGYGARLYGIDPDLPGAASFTVFDGRGVRWAMNARIGVFRGLALSAKYVQTVRNTRSSVARRFLPMAERWSIAGIQLEHTLSIP